MNSRASTLPAPHLPANASGPSTLWTPRGLTARVAAGFRTLTRRLPATWTGEDRTANPAPAPADQRWLQLQTELRDLAFMLDRGGNPEAADVAAMVAARIGELLSNEPGADSRAPTPAARSLLP